jgi:hypothetical protein
MAAQSGRRNGAPNYENGRHYRWQLQRGGDMVHLTMKTGASTDGSTSFCRQCALTNYCMSQYTWQHRRVETWCFKQ